MNVVGALWLVPVLLLPLVFAALAPLPRLRERSLSLLPMAPLPALAAAWLAPSGVVFEAPDMLLGASLSLDGNARMFLGFAALLWTAAGLYASRYMRDDERRAGFASLWCLTLAGNMGVFLADDVAGFYTAFACVSLAAYPLVVHTRSESARRAGVVYIVLALVGETSLLLAFMLAAQGAESLLIGDVREVIAGSEWRDVIIALLIVGFGIKAGLVPLHVWLPLAHPAAPTPASAVLSGAIVKAGIFGFMQFMPFGEDLPPWRELMVYGGLFTAWFGIVAGLTQSHPKTLLAYSTVSQMGLVMALLGAALQATETAAVLDVASLYAMHHGLAKGALFLGVGVIAASGRRVAVPVVLLLLLPALSMAGLPLAGGALAKLAAKPFLGGGIVEWLFTLSAIGTALLMLRFMYALVATLDRDPDARPPVAMALPWIAVIVASLVLPWWFFAAASGEAPGYPLLWSNLWSALWPALVAALVAGLALCMRISSPRLPEGDLQALVTGWLSRFPAVSLPSRKPRFPGRASVARGRARKWADGIEHLLSRWSVAGVLMLLLVLFAAL